MEKYLYQIVSIYFVAFIMAGLAMLGFPVYVAYTAIVYGAVEIGVQLYKRGS